MSKTLNLLRDVEIVFDGVVHAFVAGEVVVPAALAERIVAAHPGAIASPDDLPAKVAANAVQPPDTGERADTGDTAQPVAEKPKKARKPKKAKD